MAIAFGASLGTPVTDTDNETTSIAMTTNVTIPSAGTLILGVSSYNSGVTSTVAGGSLTYTQDKQQNGVADTNRHLAVFRAPAPSGLASGTTITATFSGVAFGRAIFGCYFTGLDAASPLDGTPQSAAGTAQAWSTATLTTTSADAVIVGVTWLDGVAIDDTPGASQTEALDFTNSANGNNASWAFLYRIVSSTGAYNASGNWNGSSAGSEWTAITTAYKASGGAAPEIPILVMAPPIPT